MAAVGARVECMSVVSASVSGTSSQPPVPPAVDAREAAQARCPHLLFRDVLGVAVVAELLDYVAAREHDFRPSVVRNRKTGMRSVETSRRDCVSLGDLGPFAARIKSVMRGVAGSALARLNLAEHPVEPRQFEIASYGDGGHFDSHIDTAEVLDRVRVVSCIYYFAATPRRFTGGELRLFGFPSPSTAAGSPRPFVDIAPETDTLVVFPSWLAHEVLPVSVPSGAWPDRRFSVICWLHRVGSPGAPAAIDRSRVDR